MPNIETISVATSSALIRSPLLMQFSRHQTPSMRLENGLILLYTECGEKWEAHVRLPLQDYDKSGFAFADGDRKLLIFKFDSFAGLSQRFEKEVLDLIVPAPSAQACEQMWENRPEFGLREPYIASWVEQALPVLKHDLRLEMAALLKQMPVFKRSLRVARTVN